MKNVIFSLIAVTTMMYCYEAGARNVTEAMAKEAAAQFLKVNTNLGDITTDNLTLAFTIDNEELGVAACYAFNSFRGGWVIMSGSTLTDAVIGYNECGSLDFDLMPFPARSLVQDYADFVIRVQNADDGKLSDMDEWDDLFAKRDKPSTKDGSTDDVILMESTWDQNGDGLRLPNGTTYDIYTPVIDGVHAPVGCVATALSQICYYYKFPEQPQKNKSYSNNGTTISVKFDTVEFDYSKMPNKIVASTPMDQRKEVAKLGYMVGVAVQMGYGSEMSGAQSNRVPNAMRLYFKYQKGSIIYRKSSLTDELRQSYISRGYADPMTYQPWSTSIEDEEWLAQLRSDLMQNRPVYMGGVSSKGEGRDAGGHAWVCHGYSPTNEGRYYMNWGWGGSSDGWFMLRANTQQGMSAGGYSFNLMQECVVGMIPPEGETDRDVFGINDVASDDAVIMAYPNPASVSVSMPYNTNSDATLYIYGVDGRVVESIRVAAGNGVATVDVRNYPAGVYIYRLNGATGKFMVE